MGINFYLNNKKLYVNKKYTVLQALEINGDCVPRFCYHPKLSVAANCRMCLIQSDTSMKPVASCAITISENMRVFTNSVLVKKARESVLEFLLINHPLDCPICDQGGECDLQDQTLIFGSDRGRYYEKKRAVFDLNFGPVVKTFMTRCIHCTRCIRFAHEIVLSKELGLIGRGSNLRVSTFLNKTLKSELSGNLGDICPVGALTSKIYAFTARPWELKSFAAVDIYENFGENFRVDLKGSEIVRILPYSTNIVKSNWLSDKSRFFFDGVTKQRSLFPLLHFSYNSKLIVSWPQIMYICGNIFKMWSVFSIAQQQVSVNFKKKIFFFFGSTLDFYAIASCKIFTFMFTFKKCLEFLFAFSDFFKPIFKSNYLFSQNLKTKTQLKCLLLISADLKNENPLLNIKINSLVASESTTVFSIGCSSHENRVFNSLGISSNSFFKLLKGKLVFCRFFYTRFIFNYAGSISVFASTSMLSRHDCFWILNSIKNVSSFADFSFIPVFVGQSHIYDVGL